MRKPALPAALPAPSLQGDEFSALFCALDDASSLMTDASCAMTHGWTRKDAARCSAMLAGAQALIDRSRRRLEEAEDAYIRTLHTPPHDRAADLESAEVQP